MIHSVWLTSLLLAMGGGIGTLARFWIGRWIVAHWQQAHVFPLATVLINISGSFLLGILAVLFMEREWIVHRVTVLLVCTGFCGGYTTFSTFSYETIRLLHSGHWGWALLNVLASVCGSLLATAVAMRIMEPIAR